MELYWFLKKHLGPVLGKYCNISVKGKENIPSGKAILAPNHSSYLDPLLICHALERKVHFLVDRSLSYIPLKYFLNGVDQILINKNPLSYTRRALKALLEEKLIGIFPEGTRSKNGELVNGKYGVAALSYHANAPIVPIAINGAYEAFPCGTFVPKLHKDIILNIGKPINFWNNKKPKTKKNLEKLTNLVMYNISELKRLPYPVQYT